MPLQSGQAGAAKSAQTSGDSTSKGQGIVYTVILDETHPYLKNNDDAQGQESSYIGAIQFRYVGQQTPDEASLPIAFPLDKNIKTLPLRNESVEIVQGQGGQVYYKRIGQEVSPNANSEATIISNLFDPQPLNSETSKNYSKVQSTGISRTNKDESTNCVSSSIIRVICSLIVDDNLSIGATFNCGFCFFVVEMLCWKFSRIFMSKDAIDRVPESVTFVSDTSCWDLN